MDLKRKLKATLIRVERGHIRDAGPSMLHPGSEVELVHSLGTGYKPADGFTWISHRGRYYEAASIDIAIAMTDPDI